MHSVLDQPGYIWIERQSCSHVDIIAAPRCVIKAPSYDAMILGQNLAARERRPRYSSAGKCRCLLDASVRPRAGETDSSRVRLDPDLQACRRRVDHQAVADHHAHMAWKLCRTVCAGEEHQITGLDVAGTDARAPEPLLVGRPWNVDADRPVRHHDQPRAVERVRPRRAPQIWLADLLPRE